jgi:Ca-activated chloride channel family protein
LLSHVAVEFSENFDVYDVYYPPGILLAERPIVISGKYRGSIPSPALKVVGREANGKKWSTELSRTSDFDYRQSTLRMLKYFWVGLKIDDIRYLTANSGYYHSFDEKEMLALALKYQVMTEVTSFLAIDNKVRFDEADLPHLYAINQPLPLPLGVSDSATGNFWNGEAANPSSSYSPPSGYSFSDASSRTLNLVVLTLSVFVTLFFL